MSGEIFYCACLAMSPHIDSLSATGFHLCERCTSRVVIEQGPPEYFYADNYPAKAIKTRDGVRMHYDPAFLMYARFYGKPRDPSFNEVVNALNGGESNIPMWITPINSLGVTKEMVSSVKNATRYFKCEWCDSKQVALNTFIIQGKHACKDCTSTLKSQHGEEPVSVSAIMESENLYV